MFTIMVVEDDLALQRMMCAFLGLNGYQTIPAANGEEALDAIERVASEKGSVQKILLRLTPGIDPHTYEAVSTGNVDSKFGSAIETGQAMAIVKLALSQPHIHLSGFHCHIGSQIFDTDPFADAADIMIRFIADVREKTGITVEELNLGGGLGVPYTEFDRPVDYAGAIRDMAAIVRAFCDTHGVTLPRIILEPGRSLVAAAGITLYTVGSVKEIPGFRTYVSVDGGMPDNPRYALYGSAYTCFCANRMDEEADFLCDLVGRCCESGDLIQEDVALPEPERGDLLAVLTTGAYNYSMASNYNRIPRPPVIMLRDGDSYVAVRRETYADLCALDE